MNSSFLLFLSSLCRERKRNQSYLCWRFNKENYQSVAPKSPLYNLHNSTLQNCSSIPQTPISLWPNKLHPIFWYLLDHSRANEIGVTNTTITMYKFEPYDRVMNSATEVCWMLYRYFCCKNLFIEFKWRGSRELFLFRFYS